MKQLLSYIMPALILWAGSLVSPAHTASAQPTSPAFTDVTATSGVKHRHYGPVVDERLRNLGPWFTALGAGGAVGDYNNDGYLDLYVTNSLSGHDNKLYKNNGDFTFSPVGPESGVITLNDDDNFSMMALFADIDNDGWKDLFVARFGKSLLFRNNGDGTFEDITDRIEQPTPRNYVAAVATDYDRDGDLDLYLGAYFPDVNLTDLAGVSEDTKLLHDDWETARNGGTNVLLENVGDGRFVDKSEAAGLTDTGWTLAIGTGDIDKDGWADFYMANDFGPDKIYRNNGDGTFEDASQIAIGIDTKKGMNAEFGDYDNDGWLDIYVTNITEPFLRECNMLWRNNGDFTFTDVSIVTNTCDTYWGWAGKFIDYDNDGQLDLYVLNGFISGNEKDYTDILMPLVLDSDLDLSDTMNWPPLGEMSFSGYEPSFLFHNEGGHTFSEVAEEEGVANNKDGRGLLLADFDNDGDEDMVVLNANQDAIVYQNNIGSRQAWVQLELEGVESTRDAIGTRVTFYSADGLRYRETNAGNGFEGQSTPIVHAGFGSLEVVDQVVVEWTSGKKQTFDQVKTNMRYKLREGGTLEFVASTSRPYTAPATGASSTKTIDQR